MIRHKKNILLIISVLIFTCNSIKSQNKFETDIKPSTIELVVKENDSIEIEIAGEKNFLPKIKKEFIQEDWHLVDNLNLKFSPKDYKLNDDDTTKDFTLADLLKIKINPRYLDLYKEVASWLGTKYKWGKSSKTGTDCSGFTKAVYKEVFNEDIDRTSLAMSQNLKEELSVNELSPGDLVFFATRKSKKINHVGIYLGEGQFIHASIKGVKVDTLLDGYYSRTFRKSGRTI